MPTLNDIINTFTETDLNLTVPLELQDVNESDLPVVNTYNTYLSAGNYSAAIAYRNVHPELEKYILDVKKYNILQAFIMNAYLYAKSQKQQCEINVAQPENQVPGDIWFKDPAITEENEVPYFTPYYLTDSGIYKEFALFPSGAFEEITDAEIDAIFVK